MGESSEKQKVCSSCNQVNKANNRFCQYCGANIESEPVSVKSEQTLDVSDINKVEITETQKESKYFGLFCTLLCFGFISFLFIFFIIRTGPSFGSVLATVLFLILMLPVMSGVLIAVLWQTRHASIPKSFSISDKEIIINLPQKPIFQIAWSEIDHVHIYKTSDTAYFSGNQKIFVINFSTTTGSIRTIGIQSGKHFHYSSIKRICSYIEQTATKQKKDYLWGKKAKKKNTY